MSDGWDAVAGPGTAPSGYMNEAEFRHSMDRVFGPGKWQETGGWRSQAREDQLRAQGANTVAPGHTSPHTLGTEDAPGAHDVVVNGLTPQQAAAKMRAEGLPMDNAYPEGASGSQGAHLHVALAQGQEDPWAPVAGPGADHSTDGWTPVAGPGAQQHGFLDEAGRLARTVAGGIASGAGHVIKGAGELADAFGQSELGEGAATGMVTDPATGMQMRVPEQARPSFAAASHQPIVSPATDKVAKGLSDWDVMVSPQDRSGVESVVHGAAEMGLPMGAALVNPAAGGAAFAAQGMSETSDEARAAGASQDTATAAGLEGGAIQGVLGMTPVGEVAAPVVRGVKGVIPHFLADLGVRSTADAALGGGMQVGENVVAEQNYDPNRPWYANVPQSAAAMALGGAGLHVLGAAGGATLGAARRILRPAETPIDTGAEPGVAPPEQPAPQDLAAAMPEAVAAHAYATNTAHLNGAVTPDEVPVQPVEPPAAFEEARIAEGAPVQEMAPAIADVEEYRSAAPKGYSLFQAIKDLGGIRTKTPDGEPISDVQQVLDGVRRPGLINNKAGLDPDTLREALQERGWFGVQDGEGPRTGDDLNDLYGLMDQEARGQKVFHPEDVAPQAILRRAEMERELALAGAGTHDPTEVAAAKLAAYRADQMKETGVAMTLLRDRAEAQGLKPSEDMSYHDLLGDVIEREAIQGEYDGAQADQHERLIDEQLTPEEHEWLAAAGRGGEGEHGSPEIAPETGWEPAFEPGEEDGDRESGAGAGGGAEGPEGLPEPHQLAPSERQTLGGEAVEQGLIPGTEQSARQAAAAREGALKPKAAQEGPGELFAPTEPDQGDLKLRRGSGFEEGAGRTLAEGLEGVAPDAATQKAHADLIDKVGKIIDRVAPTAASRPMRALRETGSGARIEAAAWRQGARHVIAWSLDTPDVVGTARHEAVHVLKGEGLFKPQEWNALAAEAMDAGWMDRYHIAERYSDLTHEGQIEEAVAERFADWRRDRQMTLPPFVRELFNRVADVLQQVAAAARKVFGQDATAADVFAAMERGDIGQRGLRRPTAPVDPWDVMQPAFQRSREDDGPEVTRRGLLAGAAAGAALAPERVLALTRTDLRGDAKVAAAIKTGRLSEVVRAIGETSRQPFHRELARILNAGGLGDAKIKVEPQTSEALKAGETDSVTGDVTLYRSQTAGENGVNEETALHEALHSYLASRYYSLGVYGERSNRAKFAEAGLKPQHADPFVDRFVEQVWKPWSDMMDATHPEMVSTSGAYDGGFQVWAHEAYSSPDELFVRVLTDPELQGFLKTTDMQGAKVDPHDPDSWWNRVVDFFARVLGIERKDDSAFGQIMDAANGVLKSAALDRPTGAVSAEVARRDQLDERIQNQRITPEPEDPKAVKARGVINRILGEGVDAVGARIAKAANRILPDPVHDLIDSFRLGVSPMSVGSERAQATAKDFANTQRETAWEWNRIDGWLEKNFTADERRRMWEAADEESVIRQRGAEPGPAEGLNRLRGGERAIVEELQKRADQAFARAKQLGMTNADPLPSYVPRMVVEMSGEGARRVRSDGANTSRTGRNLSTTTGQLHHREHMTAEETETAAKSAFGEGATVVRDIRTLGLATGKLEQAIAGRTLVNKIKEIGKLVGEDTVAEGASPEPGQFFTIDHPAMKVWGPKFAIDHETGKLTAILGPDGKPVMEAKPLYVAKEFEGPLKSVLQTPTGPIYNALVGMKAKAMSLIMYSPVMHNAVIWGKAIPAAPRQVLTFEIYRRGNVARNDVATMREALQAGLDPIGRRYFNQDVTAIAEGPQIAPGRSWTAKLVGTVPGMFDKGAGEATKRAIDRFGDVWHNTFLWDRVADLQMGLYQTIRDSEIKKGLDPQSAQRVAAHFANRYGGSLPIEGMSKAARMIANVVLFSRSFTLTNLGAYKDIVRGLPGEVQAQILRDSGASSLDRAQGDARRKALGMLAIDVGLSYVGLWLAASAASWVGQHAFQSPDQNEPGKDRRFLIRTQPDGTAIYGRLPTGKVGEELTDWFTEPMETLKRKLSPFARLMYEVAANDKGFGRKLYDPYDKTPMGLAKNTGRVVWAALSSMLPLGQLEGMKAMASGEGDKTTAALQTFLPAAGVTVSKGAPGGPQMGEVYAAKDEHDFAVQEALPAIMQQVRAGDLVGARKALNDLGVPPGLATYYIRVARNPDSRLTARRVRDFERMATPEERARFARDRAAAQGQ